MIRSLRFSLLDDVNHAVSTRLGGVSPDPYASLNMGYGTDDDEANIAENRALFTGHLGGASGCVAAANLVHGKDVAIFGSGGKGEWPLYTSPVRPGSSREARFFRADGAISSIRGLLLFMTFADCVPLLFADRRLGVVGAAHAGWRGTARGIGPAVIRAMTATFGSRPADIVAGIGPSIGPCCYSVGTDVLETFEAHGTTPEVVRNGWAKLDLWATNERQLSDAGVPLTSIENPRICTSCNVDTYFSHRAERGRTGRFALAIGCL